MISVDLSLSGHQAGEVPVTELGFQWLWLLMCKQGALLCSQALNMEQASQELSGQASKSVHVGSWKNREGRCQALEGDETGGGRWQSRPRSSGYSKVRSCRTLTLLMCHVWQECTKCYGNSGYRPCLC